MCRGKSFGTLVHCEEWEYPWGGDPDYDDSEIEDDF